MNGNNITRIKLTKFNELVVHFLNELIAQFPESNELKRLKKKFVTFKDFNWISLFMNTLKPFGEMVMERNPSFFLDGNNHASFSDQLDLRPYYEQCNEQNKDVIWTYLQTLYLLGCSYENFTPEFMQTIESIAENCENTF